jgi:hypothetical protein
MGQRVSAMAALARSIADAVVKKVKSVILLQAILAV